VFINDIIQLKARAEIPQTGINIAVSKNNPKVVFVIYNISTIIALVFHRILDFKNGGEFLFCPQFFCPYPKK
jgi:hypothetical protein